MKRILLVMLLLALVVQPTGARDRSKVIVIKVLDDTALYNDYVYRNTAAIRQICANRGIEVDEYGWDGRDLKKFRRLLRNMGDTWGSTRAGSAKNYEFAVIIGGRSGYARTTTLDYPGAATSEEATGGLIRRLWEPDSTLISALPTLVWFSQGNFGEIGGTAVYNPGLARTETNDNRLLLSSNTSRWWAFFTQSSQTDTFWTYNQHDNISNSGGKGDGTTAIDTILTSAKYPVDGTNNKKGFLAFWSRTGAIGQPFYYTGLQDGQVNSIIDAIICKHVTNITPLVFTIDIDDFGMSRHSNSMNTRAGISSINLTHDNFFSNIDSLFTVIDRYDMVLNVGATAKYLRTAGTGYAATNQWRQWVTLAEKWRDNPAIRWTVHQHGHENSADSISPFFGTINSYNDFFGKATGTVTVARVDSLYQVDIDSIEALYGVTCDDWVIPVYDALVGYRENLQDTIAAFLADRGYAARAKYSETAGQPDDYPDGAWYRGAKFLNCRYVSNTLDTLYLRYSDTGKDGLAKSLWTTMFGPMFYTGSTMTGMNPQQAAPGPIAWSNYSSYGLYKYEYGPRIDGRVLVMHFGACYTGVPGAEARNVTLIKELGQMIRYLEELSGGKDLYRCVSGEELATRWWEQIR